jgi:hypothetical protein
MPANDGFRLIRFKGTFAADLMSATLSDRCFSAKV